MNERPLYIFIDSKSHRVLFNVVSTYDTEQIGFYLDEIEFAENKNTSNSKSDKKETMRDMWD